MSQYLVRKLLQFLITLFGVAVLIFFLLRVLPGDIVAVKLAGDGIAVSPEILASERARLGLDQSLVMQFKDWIVGLFTLELGNSLWTERPVVQEIAERLPLSLELAVLATVLGVTAALPLGIAAALTRGTLIDQGIRVSTVAGLSIPGFWLGLLVQTFLLKTFGWLPPVSSVSWSSDALGRFSQLIFPALVVGWRMSAMNARMLRSSMLEVLQEDYIRTARAKGVRSRTVITHHAAKNAMLPTVTMIGLEFAFLLGGLTVTEQVFNLNGVGRLLVQAVSQNDYVLIQGLVMLFAVAFILISFAVDLLYAVLDPRVRSQR